MSCRLQHVAIRIGCSVLLAFCVPFLVVAKSKTSANMPPLHPFTAFDTSENFARSNGYGLAEDGILYFDYGTRYDGLGKFKNPTFVANYANILYREILEGDQAKKAKFFNQVDHLMDSAVDLGDGLYWAFPFENSYYAAPKGWWSAMTSGRILGVLVRAHALSGNRKYLKFAERVFKKLAIPREHSGMATYLDDGSVWLEEVAYPGAKSYRILNGHIFALAGLHDYANYTGDGRALALVNAGVRAVRNALDDFDAGFITYYSGASEGPRRYFAGRGDYNGIHAMQMLWLFEVSSDPEFLRAAMRIQAYESEYPALSVSASTNEKTHGPLEMGLHFGNRYWSSSTFPAVVTATLGREWLIDGVGLMGRTPAATPRDYLVETSLDGDHWTGAARVVANDDPRRVIPFTHTVKARFVRFSIASDNGNKNVALDGVAIVRRDPRHIVPNLCNYSSSLYKLTDSDRSTSIEVRCPGWVVVPRGMIAGNSLKVWAGRTMPKVALRWQSSSDLTQWTDLGVSDWNGGASEISGVSPDVGYVRFWVDVEGGTLAELSGLKQ